MRKRAVLGTSAPSHLGTHFDTFSLKMRKSDRVTAFLGDLEPTHIFIRNVLKTGEPGTSKMCPKHCKYAVGCKVGFLQNKVIKVTTKGSIFEAFGVTLEHFGHQMAPQMPFFERLKF